MSSPDTNTSTLLLDAYRKVSSVLQVLEGRGVELTEAEDAMWAEAEALVQEANP
jgi:hypothetical protein